MLLFNVVDNEDVDGDKGDVDIPGRKLMTSLSCGRVSSSDRSAYIMTTVVMVVLVGNSGGGGGGGAGGGGGGGGGYFFYLTAKKA